MSFSTEQVIFEARDGLRLVADVGGPTSGRPVVLVHGGGQTRHSWADTQRRLAEEGYRVINVEQRGHGDSDWSSEGDYTIEAFANDLSCVLANLNEPAAVVGASLGGIAGLFVAGASESEQPISALVLVDIALRASPKGAARIRNFMTAHAGGFASLDEAEAAVAGYNPERRQSSDGLRKNLRLSDDGRFYWHWDPRILSMDDEALRTRFEKLVAMRHKIDMPVLLVRGERSDVVTDENVAELRAQLPQTEVLQVPRAGHMVVGDRNDAFTDGILEFLHTHYPPER